MNQPEPGRKAAVEFSSASPGMEYSGAAQSAMICPNCGAELEGRKCKLLCHRPGCGYMVTCSEW